MLFVRWRRSGVGLVGLEAERRDREGQGGIGGEEGVTSTLPAVLRRIWCFLTGALTGSFILGSTSSVGLLGLYWLLRSSDR